MLDRTAGNAETVTNEAITWNRGTPEGTLRAIDERVRRLEDGNLSYTSPDRGYRTTSDMLARNVVWGCSARAQVACHLARASGVPCILAKAVDETWIQRNLGDGLAEGHVYVEVLINGQPHLWDPGYGMVSDYVPGSVMVQGGLRRIYDKGGPDEVVLSHHGSEWEEETRRLFPK